MCFKKMCMTMQPRHIVNMFGLALWICLGCHSRPVRHIWFGYFLYEPRWSRFGATRRWRERGARWREKLGGRGLRPRVSKMEASAVRREDKAERKRRKRRRSGTDAELLHLRRMWSGRGNARVVVVDDFEGEVGIEGVAGGEWWRLAGDRGW